MTVIAKKTVRIRDKAVIEFCTLLGIQPKDTLQLTKLAYGTDTPSYSAIKRGFAAKKEETFLLEDKPHPGRRRNPYTATRIKECLELHPSSSTRILAKRLDLSRETVKSYLENELQMRKMHCKWVPHVLNADQMAKRQIYSTQMYHFLNSQKKTNYVNVVTGDESWCFYRQDVATLWLPKGSPQPTRPKRAIFSEKVMITVMWGTKGFFILDALPIGWTMGAQYFQEFILSDLPKEMKKKGIARPYFLHLDNCSSHSAKATQAYMEKLKFIPVRHPPYSPDLAPSDFYLFGNVKGKLGVMDEDTPEGVVFKFQQILDTITEEERIKVFDEWMDRCYAVSQSDGSYITFK